MNANDLKSHIINEIKPKGFIFKSLTVKMLDYEYPIHTPDEMKEALEDFTPKPYVAAKLGVIGFDCNKQTLHMIGHLMSKDKVAGIAWSNAGDMSHYFLVFWCERLYVLEPRSKWIVPYKEVQDPFFNGMYNLSKGFYLFY